MGFLLAPPEKSPIHDSPRYPGVLLSQITQASHGQYSIVFPQRQQQRNRGPPSNIRRNTRLRSRGGTRKRGRGGNSFKCSLWSPVTSNYTLTFYLASFCRRCHVAAHFDKCAALSRNLPARKIAFRQSARASAPIRLKVVIASRQLLLRNVCVFYDSARIS
jgi:hypothetical protein